jgi:predicted TPR repeat methyltransferase
MTSPSQRKLLNKAELHVQAGRKKRGIAIYQQVLRQDPGCVDALFALAVLLHDAGEFEAAARRLRELLKYCPDLAEVHFNLGTILNSLGQREDAIAAFRRAIELRPDLADAHNNLGIAYREFGQPELAMLSFEQAVFHAPNSLAALLNYSAALLKCHRIDDAVRICRRAYVCHPESADVHYALGISLERAGLAEEALFHLNEAVRLRPDATEWRYHLAACQGTASAAPPTAPVAYVTSLFDNYAARFDEHLVSNLQYRTPQHLRAAVQDFRTGTFKSVLDLGCGTGLCGDVFKPVAECLVGVDLSSEMISVARRRNIYEELHVADIVEYLAGQNRSCDLILAADVFIYVGDLNEIFRRVSMALQPNGLFAFSVESNNCDTWMLGPTRRYSHGVPYLKKLAFDHNLVEKAIHPVVLRMDRAVEVHGLVVVLEKPDCNPPFQS